MSTIELDSQKLKNSIAFLLPAAPVVGLAVNKAFAISEKYLSKVNRKYHVEDNMFLHALRVALEVTKRNKELCKSDDWFNYIPTIVALLHDVIEDADSPQLRKELDEAFGTVDNKILEGILALTNSEEEIKAMGRSKYMMKKFNELEKTSNDYFMVKVADRKDNIACLNEIQNTQEYIENPKKGEAFRRNYLLETFLILVNRNNNKNVIHSTVYPIYNDLSILVNKSIF